jgi:hypothetical protein
MRHLAIELIAHQHAVAHDVPRLRATPSSS